MADVFAFPAVSAAETQAGASVSLTRPGGVPDDVWNAVVSIAAMRKLSGVRYRELPVGRDVADYGIGVSMTAERPDAPDVSGAPADAGWIYVLHGDGMDAAADSGVSQGPWRCVGYLTITGIRHADSLTSAMVWESVRDSVGSGVAGTVTVSSDTSFGVMRGDSEWAREFGRLRGHSIEVRASWTPRQATDAGFDAGECVRVWSSLLVSLSGELAG